METLYRIATLIILALLAGPLLALTVNVLIITDALPTGELSSDLGRDIMMKATYVWLASLIAGIIALFINQSWRKYLLALPLIAPSLFAVLYSIGL